jgi:hypothetical protein
MNYDPSLLANGMLVNYELLCFLAKAHREDYMK